jgi:hypothetical protein
MSRHFGTALEPRSVPGVRKTFDFVSADGRVIGDAKFYTLVAGSRLPPAKFSGIAEYVWLLGQTAAEHRFLIFGNDRRVSEEWLKRYGSHLAGIEFYFLDAAGELHLLRGSHPVSPLHPSAAVGPAALAPATVRQTGPLGREQSVQCTRLIPSSRSEGDMESFEAVWRRILAHEGDEFQTTTGLPFTYEIAGEVLHPSRTRYNIAKSQIEKAFELVPFDGPGTINAIVRGPSYVWAILHDERIRGTSW